MEVPDLKTWKRIVGILLGIMLITMLCSPVWAEPLPETETRTETQVEEPTPDPEETPDPEPQETPTPDPQETPTPKPDKTPTPKPEKTPAPKPKETPTPQPQKTPAGQPSDTHGAGSEPLRPFAAVRGRDRNLRTRPAGIQRLAAPPLRTDGQLQLQDRQVVQGPQGRERRRRRKGADVKEADIGNRNCTGVFLKSSRVSFSGRFRSRSSKNPASFLGVFIRRRVYS